MQDCSAWFADKEFTTDWVSWNLETWSRLTGEIRAQSPNVLEIGSWEGRSAVAWLNLLPESHVTCLDAWYEMATHEARFDRNTAPYGSRVRKIVANSRVALTALIGEGRSFDLIYLDGEHSREGTLRDSVLAWPLLKHGGIMLWDDYLWETHLPLKDRPQQAIDWFVCAHQDDLDIIHRGYQVAGVRRGDRNLQGIVGEQSRSTSVSGGGKALAEAPKSGHQQERARTAVSNPNWTELYYPLPACEGWFDGGDYTSDWVTWKLGLWTLLATKVDAKHPAVLEIGSWEGRSAMAWLNLLPRGHITCIDRWREMPAHEARFDRNTAPYGTRIRKIVGKSDSALATLIAEGRSFDLIYIDGEHTREATLRDSVLAWPLLREGGILLWDDYLWEMHLSLKERPQAAIDWFLENHFDEIDVLHRGYQVAVRRIPGSAR